MSHTAAHVPEQDVVRLPNHQEWQLGVERELAALGLTYAELTEQANARNFQSAEAMNLWVIIGKPRR
jgi:hypothetical protein